jgi:hypothetical protein
MEFPKWKQRLCDLIAGKDWVIQPVTRKSAEADRAMLDSFEKARTGFEKMQARHQKEEKVNE